MMMTTWMDFTFDLKVSISFQEDYLDLEIQNWKKYSWRKYIKIIMTIRIRMNIMIMTDLRHPLYSSLIKLVAMFDNDDDDEGAYFFFFM